MLALAAGRWVETHLEEKRRKSWAGPGEGLGPPPWSGCRGEGRRAGPWRRSWGVVWGVPARELGAPIPSEGLVADSQTLLRCTFLRFQVGPHSREGHVEAAWRGGRGAFMGTEDCKEAAVAFGDEGRTDLPPAGVTAMVSSDSQTQRTALSWPRWRRGGEGMTRESGISGCKRLYIRCINNKSLQDSTGNYMEYAVISHHGKEYGKESMCITESLCCAEINTTLYIKYTSIKWMKKMKPETTMISWDWPWA